MSFALSSKIAIVASSQPLADKRIVVSRSRDQASALSDQLRSLGAEPVEVPMIDFAAPSDDGAAARAAINQLDRYDWVVLTSPNGARAFGELLSSRAGGSALPRIACVGPGTARQLTDRGIGVDLVPDRSVAEGLLASFPSAPASGASLLLFQAEVSRDVLHEGLAELGWAVDRVAGYRTIDAALTLDDRTAAADSDIVTFMSSSAVDRFVRLVGSESLPPVVACIGPITADTARAAGLQVDIEADEHTLDGLIDALVSWADRQPES